MPDYSEIEKISQQMLSATLKLAALTTPLAKAKQVLGWEGERRKALLAKYVVAYLDQDIAAGASEHRARAHPDYIKGMADLIRQSRDAEEIVCKADALKTEFEAMRSLLSTQKQILGML